MRQLSPKRQAKRRLLENVWSCAKIIGWTLFCFWITGHYEGTKPWYIETLLHCMVVLNIFMAVMIINGVWRWWRADDSHHQPDDSYRKRVE